MSLHASDDTSFTVETPFADSFRARDFRSALLFKVARKLRKGRLRIETPGGERLVVDSGVPGSEGHLKLHRWRALRRLLLGGDLGFAEAYIDGDWTSHDLTTMLELAAQNMEEIDATIRGSWPLRALNRLRHRRRRNSKRGSGRNISEHYDLGNDFYAEWLDPGMTYSSAIYADDSVSLEEAQAAKYRRVLDLLNLNGGERVLEIGCGWGGMAEALVGNRVGSLTALTLSRAQLDYTIKRLGRDDVDVQLTDYRDVTGSFDRIVSIEMLEAVGEENWPRYFEVLRQRLNDGGSAVLQAITISDHRYESYRRGADYIQRHIFPGGMLPSPSILKREIEHAGFTLTAVDTFGMSYAKTLAEWQRRFQQSWPRIAGLGFPARFKRKWEYYLAYCEAGFRTGLIDVGLYRIEKTRS